MTAATQDRNTVEVAGLVRAFPMEAASNIYAGTLACVNAAGNMVRGSTSAALRCVGVARQRYDNATGTAGAVMAEAKAGVFGLFANSAAADQITNADCGADCYIVDDQTVAKTNGGGTRSVAGKVWTLDGNGVWIKFV
ncbi:MAG: hypothetical protein ABL916_24370 [Burkholderiaceae bacterium]